MRKDDKPAAKAGLMADSTRAEVHGTLGLLRWLKAFIASQATHARDPWGHASCDRITRDQAAHKLVWLVDVAVNRRGQKSGQSINHGLGEGAFSGSSGRQQIDFERDAASLRDIRRRIRVYQFSSKVCRHRLAHLLADRADV